MSAAQPPPSTDLEDAGFNASSTVLPLPGKPEARSEARRAPPVADAATEPARRPRGRPRKSLQHLDEGNRRRELMDAAAKLFQTQGYAATSIRDIAAAVGMHSGSPFYFFKSKAALLHAVMYEGMLTAEQSQQHTLQQLPQHAPPQDVLRALIRHHLEIVLGQSSGFIPVMLYEWRSLTPEHKASVARIKDVYESHWVPVLEALAQQGVLHADPSITRLFIFGALHWAVQWYSPHKGMTLDELSNQAMALFLRKV